VATLHDQEPVLTRLDILHRKRAAGTCCRRITLALGLICLREYEGCLPYRLAFDRPDDSPFESAHLRRLLSSRLNRWFLRVNQQREKRNRNQAAWAHVFTSVCGLARFGVRF